MSKLNIVKKILAIILFISSLFWFIAIILTITEPEIESGFVVIPLGFFGLSIYGGIRIIKRTRKVSKNPELVTAAISIPETEPMKEGASVSEQSEDACQETDGRENEKSQNNCNHDNPGLPSMDNSKNTNAKRTTKTVSVWMARAGVALLLIWAFNMEIFVLFIIGFLMVFIAIILRELDKASGKKNPNNPIQPENEQKPEMYYQENKMPKYNPALPQVVAYAKAGLFEREIPDDSPEGIAIRARESYIMSIDYAMEVKGYYGTLANGRIINDCLKQGETILIYSEYKRNEPSTIKKNEATILKIIKSNKEILEAKPRDNVVLVLDNVSEKEIKRGAKITKVGQIFYHEMEKLIKLKEAEIEQLANEALSDS